MTTRQIASFLGVQHELVRDAASELFHRHDGCVFTDDEVSRIRGKIAQWRRLAS